MGKTRFEIFKPSFIFCASALREGHNQWDGFADSFRQDIELGGSCFKLLPFGFRDTVDDLLLSSTGIAACSGRAGEIKGADDGVFCQIGFVLTGGQFLSLEAHVNVGCGGHNWNNEAKASVQLGLAEL